MEKKIKVAFILPAMTNNASGGYKIVYEYVKRLNELNFDCHIFHVYNFTNEPTSIFSLKYLKYVKKYIELKNTENNWLPLVDPNNIHHIFRYSDLENESNKFNAVFATSIYTASPVSKLSMQFGRKFYLIQHWENWYGFSDTEVLFTWKLGMENIVISKWLLKKAKEAGIKAHYITNGLDFINFNKIKPYSERSKFNILMLGHIVDWKGTKDGIEAIRACRKRYPKIRLIIFSAFDLTSLIKNDLDWITIYYSPTVEVLNQLYNEASIFVAPSWSEGWGLTAAEALQCGCALVCTENGGYQEFAINNKTALTSPVKRLDMLSDNIIKLIENDDLRFELALSGNSFIQQFTWENSISKMATLIETTIY